MEKSKLLPTIVACGILGCIGLHSKHCENAEAYHTEVRTAGETQQKMPKVLSTPFNFMVNTSGDFFINAEPGTYRITGN